MEFTVAAFNAHWGVGRFGNMRGVRFDVARVVREFDADIVVVAEAWRGDDGVALLESLNGDYNVETVDMMALNLRKDLSARRDGAPLEGMWELAVCSRYPVLDSQPVMIGNVGADPVNDRNALAVTLDLEGTRVEVFGLHTSSRLLQFAPLRHLRGLKNYLSSDGPQIIAGDFNFWGPPIGLFMRGWKRPVRGRTYPAHRPHSQIDHVLVRGGIEPLGGEVLAETPSDHRPVRARLRL
jgi:endonuclease/exonuclease/phosphatase family metal-dependent hydrolase